MRTHRRRPITAAITCLALAVPLAGIAAPAAAAEPSPIRINEVAQNSDITDWVELINTGSEAVDVSGWVVKDDKDERTLAFAAGTSIAAGGFLTIDVDADEHGDAGFGLGRADTVRVFSADGATLIDSHAWSDHTLTSYGRCADGVGDFRETAGLTKGAANLCELNPVDVVRINEVESNGDVEDWIELTNIGRAPVDISGLVVKDNDDARVSAVPAGTSIPAGGFYVIEPPVIDFGLGAADSARLFTADGSTLIDSADWTSHAATSLARCPDGIGAFDASASTTKGAPNDCVALATPAILINEVESSGGTPGDWVELLNTGATDVDLSRFIVSDSDDSHISVLPAGSIIAAGGYLVVEEAQLGFGLGSDDQVRLFLADGFTVVDARSWSGHATTSYGLCGTEFVTTTSPTKGAANDCSAPVRINEIESNDGVPGDWIEIINVGAQGVDVSNFTLSDNDDAHVYVIPAGTTIAPGGYLVAEVDGDTGFGLGKADSARLFDAGGALLDSHSWTAHAATSYGRCADGSGGFAETRVVTKGAVNSCVGDLITEAWPGSSEISEADTAGTLGGNMSGLAYEAAAGGDVLWAAKNGEGTLYRLVADGNSFIPDAAEGWGAGKPLHYPDGTGDVDAEGVTLTAAGADGGVFIASERNNAQSGVSRLSVLRYDVSDAASTAMTAIREWDLTADLPAVGPNAGLEAIAWVPDSYLVAGGLLDENSGVAYDPADYAGHGDGLFFVGVEAGGAIHAYALDQVTGGFDRIASIDSGFHGVMDLEFEAERGALWAVCDDGCDGRSAVLDIAETGKEAGRFAVTTVFERPAGMPNINNEGFAIAPTASCVDGAKSVFWADDSNTGGHAIRVGSLDCETPVGPTVPPVKPTEPPVKPTEPPVKPTTPPVTPTTPPVTPTVPPVGPGNPVPPSAAQLTELNRGGLTVPTSVVPGATFTATLPASGTARTLSGWLFSEPTALGMLTVAADGAIQITLPASVPAGEHRLAVSDAAGTIIGWDEVTVTSGAPAPTASGSLASTGVNPAGAVGLAVLVLLGGALLLAARRPRTR
ncbi:MAG: lamin tail domain-containing protein [Leifsonia sp.]